jgi:hypothetical protein
MSMSESVSVSVSESESVSESVNEFDLVSGWVGMSVGVGRVDMLAPNMDFLAPFSHWLRSWN